MASYAPFRSSLVQRYFFCDDVIANTSWASDVVNLVHPFAASTFCSYCESTVGGAVFSRDDGPREDHKLFFVLH